MAENTIIIFASDARNNESIMWIKKIYFSFY